CQISGPKCCFDNAHSAFRSATINLINYSGSDITFVDATLDRGIWTSQCNPNVIDRIHNGQNITFANESTGKLNNLGSVRFIVGCTYILNIYWENPIYERNLYFVYISPSNSPYVVEETGGHGYNSLYSITIRMK
ncbi:3738_t:CDS:1, partial [Dentiscutata erythropus]